MRRLKEIVQRFVDMPPMVNAERFGLERVAWRHSAKRLRMCAGKSFAGNCT
jgi:hypothetical protein